MSDDRLNMIVGLVLLPLICAAVIVVLVIGDRPLRPVVSFGVEFDYVGQLQPGSKVKMANMVIGKVKHITFVDKVVDGKQVRRVRAYVWVYRRHQRQIWRNSKVFVASASLIGERHLELAAPDGPPGKQIQDGDVLMGKSPSYLDRFLAMSYQNLVATTDMIKEIDPHWKKLQTNLDSVISEMDRLKRHEQQIRSMADRAKVALDSAKASYRTLKASTDDFRAFGRIERRVRRFGRRAKAGVTPLVARVERLIDLFDALLTTLRERVPAAVKIIEARADRTTALFKQITAYVKVIERAMNRGTGTLGAFMKERELFDDLKASGRVIRQQIWRNIARPKKTSVKDSPVVP